MSIFKPLIEVANRNSTSVVAGAAIPFTTAVHGNSSVLTSNGTGVSVNRVAGYYEAIAKVSFTVPVAGDVTLSIVKDGTVIAKATVTATTATTYNVVIPVIFLSKCCTLPNTISVTTDLAITSVDATLDVAYLSERN